MYWFGRKVACSFCKQKKALEINNSADLDLAKRLA